jgi:hypothetical protein
VIPSEYQGGGKSWGVLKNENFICFTKGKNSLNNMPSKYTINCMHMFYEWEGNGAYLVIGVRSLCTMQTLLYANHEVVRVRGIFCLHIVLPIWLGSEAWVNQLGLGWTNTNIISMMVKISKFFLWLPFKHIPCWN